MKIWVDADACPVAIKDILYRAATRTETEVTLVANQYLKTPPSKYIALVQVPKGFDVADNEIVQRSEPGDLVITSDIPLADEVISKGCLALSPRGELFSKENIKSRLNIRDFLDTLRSSGIQSGGPSALTAAEKQTFGNQLDRWLQKRSRLQ
ncbi:YaiI/YqxD family protein [Marinimicrobium sp. ARAG 43.8]|uniref:YaiI/YqxD family protein n=1 Tax=Marinimicrobium sp. ARAG 43.8 TaxID=3418719 RepID=UPI003CE68878